MNFKKYFIFLSLVVLFLFSSRVVFARDAADITDWYIKDFQTNIVVNKDSSLLITENITADCGNLPDKHGIFRVLPTQIDTGSGVFKSLIELVSITDFNNNPYPYQASSDWSNNTITWKIGDPNKTVTGVNYYRIIYKVKNAVRFGNKDFDELYWNLLGNYWDIGTDNFSAQISFPPEVNSQNAAVDYYTGALGSKDKSLATYSWDSNNVLNFNSVSTGQFPVFQPGQGLTASVTFPKNIFTPYVPTFWEQYGDYFWYLSFLIPLGVFLFAFLKWRKYGKDPKMPKPIPPEFGIPNNITPMQMGLILSHGVWKNSFITATIIDLAVRKFITIEQTENKVLFLTEKDILLKKNGSNYDLSKVTPTEKILLSELFMGQDSIKLSSLKNSFYQNLPAIKKSATDDVYSNGWMEQKSNLYFITFLASAIVLGWISFSVTVVSVILFASLFASAIILGFFAVIMPKRTQAGVDLLFKIKGFELYMKEAEKYREKFNEKENIFDQFLPYAIIFGIAELWAKKMQLIYGDDYFNHYHPVWLVGAIPSNFNVNTFTSQLNSISTSISSNVGGPSGAGGMGGAGGGGGGGGGGGW